MDFKVWKTVTIGLYPTIKKYLEAIAAAGAGVSYEYGERFYNMSPVHSHPISEVQKNVDLVVCTTSQLGFDQEISYYNIPLRANSFGLRTCGVEPFLSLCLALQVEAEADPEYAKKDLWCSLFPTIDYNAGTLIPVLRGMNFLESMCVCRDHPCQPDRLLVFTLPSQ